MKSCNVVIKGDFETVKICDVGVSLQLDENMRVSDPKAEYIGTEPWKPKEALDEGGEITDRADIFASGLTLWEMMTLAMPHLEMLDDDEEDEENLMELSFDERLGAGCRGSGRLALEDSGVKTPRRDPLPPRSSRF